MCGELGLAEDALLAIFKANNWQFFIQANALLEAAVNHALAARLKVRKGVGEVDTEAVAELVGRLPYRGRAGRIAFLRLSELFPEPLLRQLEAFATIRNAYAHEVRSISKTTADLLRNMPEQKRRSVVDALVATPLEKHLLPDQDPIDMVEPVAHIQFLLLLAWITKFKRPRGLLSLGFAAAGKD